MKDLEIHVALAKLTAEVLAVGEKVDRVYWHLERQNGRIEKAEKRVETAENKLMELKGWRSKLTGVYLGVAASLAILASIVTLASKL